MYNHAPPNYKCPICIGLSGIKSTDTLIEKSDIVYSDDLVTAFINSFFIGVNHGHVIIVPNKHFENIYELPIEYATRIQEVAKRLALVIKKAYNCDGITTLQNNEPAGGQHAFHYHFHIFPRYDNDELHKNMLIKKSTTPKERLPYAEKIRAELALQGPTLT